MRREQDISELPNGGLNGGRGLLARYLVNHLVTPKKPLPYFMFVGVIDGLEVP
jgi:hypothetical protein